MTSKLASLPVALPTASITPSQEEAIKVGKSFEARLGSLGSSDLAADVIWRDLFALTGSLRTFYGEDVVLIWQKLASEAGAQKFALVSGSARVVSVGPDSNWIDVAYTFETTLVPAAECKIIVSVVYAEDEWRIWVIRTMLQRLKAHPSIDELNPKAVNRGNPVHEESEDGHVFECVVVGAGQAGLSVAGRLKSQGVDYVVLDTNPRVGDNWRNRYRSVKLHTTRQSSHLPFNRTFPSTYGEWLTKDDLAEGYENWAKEFDIRVLSETSLVKGSWLEKEDMWELRMSLHGNPAIIKAKHVVMAIGGGCQIPIMPSLEDKALFKGSVLHSSAYKSADEWNGKKGVVIGTANTAHDVAEDMLAAGLDSVTMIQRSPTYVLPTEHYKRIQDGIYNDRVDTALADALVYSNPIALSRVMNMRGLHKMADAEPERFDALEDAGFKLIRHGDIVHQLFERFGGHYMDVGASAKISRGLIKVKSDALATGFYERGLAFDDGSKVEADVIVCATGFVGNMKLAIRDPFSEHVADQLDDFWGIDSEGEIRGAFRPSGHPRLWLHGGTCGQARYFSRFIALQVRAALDGTPLRVFTREGKFP